MIGSPDLLAFTGAEGFGEARERAGELQGVPEELSVPLLPRAHPWAATSSALFLRDFILVAEFSEQVGRGGGNREGGRGQREGRGGAGGGAGQRG